jgi:rod shape-determining protein MreC
MFERLRSQRHVLVLLALVALPLATIALSSNDGSIGRDTGTLGGFARRGLGWVQTGQHRLFAGIGQFWSRWTTADLERENHRLEQKVARLREEKSRLIGVLQENARLRELLGFKKRHPEYDLASAEVVGRNVSSYFRVLTLKLRSQADLEAGMPVVVAQGVVGQIHRTYGSFAEVVIVSDPRSRIDAVSQRNRAHGIVEGLGHERSYRAEIAYLRRRDRVREGDVMVTSGMGGVFPPELIIGTVERIESRERGLFQKATLQPAVDFSRLEEVFVMTDT